MIDLHWKQSRLPEQVFLVLVFTALLTTIFAGSSFPKDVNPDLHSRSNPEKTLPPIDTFSQSFVKNWLKSGQYMATDQVRAGMTGYGLTVFQGTHIEKFNVKVIGVVKKVINGRDAILVRLSGGPMSNNNVIKGMSGSPVYIDGKLIGAISFGYDFSKEPIAGITPIADMLDALAPNLPVDSHSLGFLDNSRSNEETLKSNTSSASPHLVPLVSPVALVGFSPRAEEFLSHYFKHIGMSVSSGAAGAQNSHLTTNPHIQIEPGSAVSILLSTGDFYTVATGTATARFGGKVIAFGHPFLQAGAVDFPMATAFIHNILPSLFVSFKVASPINVVGSFLSDRPWSVGGQIGKTAKLIPATYTVTDQARHLKRTFHCQIVDHPDLTPELLASTAMSAIDSTHQSSGPYVAHVESHIEADGIESIHRVDRFSTNLTPHTLSDSASKFHFVADPISAYLLRTTAQITDNEFQKASIKKVDLNITLEDGHQTAELEKVYVDRPFVAPGDKVDVSYVLRPYNSEPTVNTLSFAVPRDTPDGNLLLAVASGDEINTARKRMGIVDPTAESLKQVRDLIVQKKRGDQVVLVAALPKQSLIVKGMKLTNPPAHWVRLFYSNRHTKGPSLVKGELQVSKDTDWLITGSHMLTIEVRSPEKVLARTHSYTVPIHSIDEDILTTEQARKALESSRKTQSTSGAQTSSSSTSNQSTTKQTSTTAAPEDTSKDYPHIRTPRLWRQDTEEDFRAGKLHNATVDSWGRMQPGFQELEAFYLPTEEQIWAGTWSGGYFWYGTQDSLWRWRGDKSKPQLMAKLEGPCIPALTSDSHETIYAASATNGTVWAISEGRKPNIIFKATESIITSLCVDDQDNLYVGTASSGRVYKINAAKQATLHFDSGQAHVLSLFYSRTDKQLYIGTGEKGIVYRLDADGKAKAIYQSPDHLITGIACDTADNLFVASAGQGHLVRVLPNGESEILASSEAFYTLYYDPKSDSILTGDAEGDITRAHVDPYSLQPYFVPVCHTEQEAVLTIASDDKARLFAGTANSAMLRSFEMKPAEDAIYFSAIHDAQNIAKWSHVNVFGAFNETNKLIPKNVTLETRTGNSSRPDETWSQWQSATCLPDAFILQSPLGRFFQYKLSWKQTSEDILAQNATVNHPVIIGRVDTHYLPTNSAPKITSVSLKNGTAVSGKKSLSLTGSDPDHDNMLLSIELSNDNTQSWKQITSELRTKTTTHEKSSTTQTSDSDSNITKDNAAEEKDAKDQNKAEPLQGSIESNDEHESIDVNGKINNSQLNSQTSKNTKESAKEASKKKSEQDSNKENEKEDKDSQVKRTKKSNKLKHPISTTTSDKESLASSETTTESFSWSWDTNKYSDGPCILKFVLNDRLSNANSHAQVICYRSTIVDNSPPQINAIETGHNPDGTINFKVVIADKWTNIVNVTYKLDDSEPYALSSLDGIVDATTGTFGVSTLKAKPSSHKLEIKATDAAGNTSTKSFTIK